MGRRRLRGGRWALGVDAVDHRAQPSEAQPIEAEDQARKVGDLRLAFLLGKRANDLEHTLFQDVCEIAAELVDERCCQERIQADDGLIADQNPMASTTARMMPSPLL